MTTTRGLVNYTTCRICRKTVGMTDAGLIYAHGTRTDRCPGSWTRVAAVVALLDEIQRMRKEHNS